MRAAQAPGMLCVHLKWYSFASTSKSLQAVDFVRKRLARRMMPQAICEAMCDHCLAPDTQVPFLTLSRLHIFSVT